MVASHINLSNVASALAFTKVIELVDMDHWMCGCDGLKLEASHARRSCVSLKGKRDPTRQSHNHGHVKYIVGSRDYHNHGSHCASKFTASHWPGGPRTFLRKDS